MRTLKEMQQRATSYLMVNTPFDHARAIQMAEDLAMLTDWADKALPFLQELERRIANTVDAFEVGELRELIATITGKGD